jgi:hypothetical protein
MVLMNSENASAYSVKSGVSDSCHEKITYQAYIDQAHILDTPSALPGDDTWKSLDGDTFGFHSDQVSRLSELETYVLVSLVIGSRAPDTEGHSIMNISNLHFLHGDDSAQAQYTHSVRGSDDDFEEGNAIAVAGARQLILDLETQSKTLLSGPDDEQHIVTQVYLDFYGRIDVTVWGPAYYTGRAVHTLQDSFSHSIRSDQDSLRKIVHVMNYVDAISSDFNEERDGIAHSEYFDKCEKPEVAPLVEAAKQASSQFLEAALKPSTDGEQDSIVTVLDDWQTLKPGCNKDNGYCGNESWVKIARKKQTGPYLEEMLGCSYLGSKSTNQSVYSILLAVLAVVVWRRTRKERR